MNIKTELQLTEITLYISLMVAFIVLILLYLRSGSKGKRTITKEIPQEGESNKPKPEPSILEIFD